MRNLFNLFVAIIRKNENAAYTALANVSWVKKPLLDKVVNHCTDCVCNPFSEKK